MMISTKEEALRKGVKAALTCSEVSWYRHMIRNDVSSCALSLAEEDEIIKKGMYTASAMTESVVARYGSLTPQELLEKMHITLVHTTEELREPFLYLALYQPGDRMIMLNDSALECIEQFIRKNQLEAFTPPEDIIRLSLFHELYHVLEEETPGIYTRSNMLHRKFLGVFPYTRGLGSVPEVGAVHFSKCMAKTHYSPCIYERYLLLALNLISIDFLLPTV